MSVSLLCLLYNRALGLEDLTLAKLRLSGRECDKFGSSFTKFGDTVDVLVVLDKGDVKPSTSGFDRNDPLLDLRRDLSNN